MLFIESSKPSAAILGLLPQLDKVAHFFAFGLLGYMLCALSYQLKPKPTIQFFSMPLLVVLLTGILEESYQLIVPGRTASLVDLSADLLGAIFAIAIANRTSFLNRAYRNSAPKKTTF